MGTHFFNRHTTWTVIASLLVALGLGACSDVSTAPAPTPLPPGTPVANAGPDLGSITFGTSIKLSGGASVDPNGDPLTYKWTLLSKPVGSAAVLQNSTTVAPTFIVDRDGDYIVQLIVNDGKLDSAPDTATISSNNVPPVANAGHDQGGKAPGTLILLSGSASTDANGDPLTYSWSLTPPADSLATLSSTTDVSPTFTVDRDGTYTAQLIVNDGTVNSTLPDTVTISSLNVFTIGGTVSGLTGAGLVLQNNGGDNLPVPANGVFTFLTGVATGQPYAVTVLTQPIGQSCTVANGSGTTGNANVTNVAVHCVVNEPL